MTGVWQIVNIPPSSPFLVLTLSSGGWPQDAASSPLSGLLDVEQRQAAAGRLNAAVLQSQQQEKGPWLPDLLRQLVYSQVGAALVFGDGDCGLGACRGGGGGGVVGFGVDRVVVMCAINVLTHIDSRHLVCCMLCATLFDLFTRKLHQVRTSIHLGGTRCTGIVVVVVVGFDCSMACVVRKLASTGGTTSVPACTPFL